ncbi:antitermination protein Q [Hafnia paralvei]|uniref:antiterminator Q family protein n=1 Tax=Hafnia paralvei TaxID=546367 RepID=UPI0010347213|nr:antiterminator Q family protein [Hafnia paralvei]TBM14745.1 antitermination protein Q [Hafnia paralvei]
MRDIKLVLECWGGWARDNSSINYPAIAAGFKGLLLSSGGHKYSCSDYDGAIIDSAVSRLKNIGKHEELQLIIMHYVYRESKRRIARYIGVSESRVRQEMQVAESFIEGCLIASGGVLYMDGNVGCNMSPNVNRKISSCS